MRLKSMVVTPVFCSGARGPASTDKSMIDHDCMGPTCMYMSRCMLLILFQRSYSYMCIVAYTRYGLAILHDIIVQ